MQVSIETLSGLERRMTIGVPAETIEAQVQDRLQEAARTFQMKGFRKGKVPLKVIKNRFGKGVRQEVLGEVMSQSYYEAVNKENMKPAGQPRIEPKTIEEGKDLEFTAVFEVFPEVALQDFSAIRIEKKVADITDADVDKMIETLREQRIRYEEVERPAQEKDQLHIDFVGTIDGEAFEGGEASGVNLILGSGRMIPGFEDALAGAEKGKEVTVKLTFPKDYQKEDLAGKKAQFAVTVHTVSAPVLPELNDAFFASFDVKEGGEAAFREEVKGNMARELKNASRRNVKEQVIDALVSSHDVDVPKALLGTEINALRQQAMQQFGGANVDPKMLPDELFREQAERRVKIGLIMNEIITGQNVKSDPKRVRTMIEEMAEGYEEPEEVIKWYYSNEQQLASIEAMAVEEEVIDRILEAAKVDEVNTSYEEALKPSEKPADRKAGAKTDKKAKASAKDKAGKSGKKAPEESEDKEQDTGTQE